MCSAPVDGEDFYGVGDAFEGDFAGLGDVPVAVGGGLAADEGADAGRDGHAPAAGVVGGNGRCLLR